MAGFSESDVEEAALAWLSASAGALPAAPISHPVNQRPSAGITSKVMLAA